MGPAIVLGQVLEVTPLMSQANQQFQSTFSWKVTAISGAVIDFEALVTTLDATLKGAANFTDKLQALLGDNVSIDKLRYQLVQPIRYTRIELTAALSGTKTGSQATNLAAVLTKRGQLAGRQYIGANHIPFPDPATFAQDGNIKATYRTDMSAFAQIAYSAISITGGTTATLTACFRNAANPTDPTFIDTYVPQTTLRVMRRRTVGIGI